MCRRFLVSLGLLSSLTLAAHPGPAGAQLLTPDRVQVALELTDRRIERAEPLVSSAENDRAQAELAMATDLQSRAWSAFRATAYATALRLTQEARGHADRAIALASGLPDPDRVRLQVERTRELLERARERIEECQNDRARALMSVALSLQARAEDAARSGRYLAALQLTMSARERGLRALRLCNMADDRGEATEHALQRTDELIHRAQDAVAERGNDAARQALARAQHLQDQAWTEFRAGRNDAALRLTQNARAAAYRALRSSGGVL